MPQPCGTWAAYKRHHKNGETPCAACLAANRERSEQIRANRPAPQPTSKPCAACGATFSSLNVLRRYCTTACRSRAQRARARTT